MTDTKMLLKSACKAWSAAADFRARRLRYKKYTYGKQWCDAVPYQGHYVEEWQLIEANGKKPLTNNLIRQIVKTVIGRFRAIAEENGLYEGGDAFIADNALPELDSRLLEEFLISGCAVQRVGRDSRFFKSGTVIENVNPRSFFVNGYHDPLGRDIELIGMLHDMGFAEVAGRFGRGDRRTIRQLKAIYNAPTGERVFSAGRILGDDEGSPDFFFAPDGKCRVIEVWTLDYRPAPAGKTVALRPDDFVWRCRWLAPDGTLLAEHGPARTGGRHPFVVKLYPLTDGEIHSFVEDIIDQQRYVNRLIVMMDHILASTAKGVLLFPVEQLPKDSDWASVAEAWARCDGVIPITGAGPQMPTQVVTTGAGNGAYQLLSLEMDLMEKISGVSEALAGRQVSPATGVSLYESQIRNATIALADLLETFVSMIKTRNDIARK